MQIIMFATLVASFDIMLGYTGILSFGHGMFFGIGAYCVAFLIGKYGASSYLNLILGFVTAGIVASALALLISFLSLRVKTIFFAMTTLAIAELAIVLATKFGFVREGGAVVGISGKPEYVRDACDASLERLGFERIDLYYQHRIDPAVPVEETVGAIDEFHGKVDDHLEWMRKSGREW